MPIAGYICQFLPPKTTQKCRKKISLVAALRSCSLTSQHFALYTVHFYLISVIDHLSGTQIRTTPLCAALYCTVHISDWNNSSNYHQKSLIIVLSGLNAQRNQLYYRHISGKRVLIRFLPWQRQFVLSILFVFRRFKPLYNQRSFK